MGACGCGVGACGGHGCQCPKEIGIEEPVVNDNDDPPVDEATQREVAEKGFKPMDINLSKTMGTHAGSRRLRLFSTRILTSKIPYLFKVLSENIFPLFCRNNLD